MARSEELGADLFGILSFRERAVFLAGCSMAETGLALPDAFAARLRHWSFHNRGFVMEVQRAFIGSMGNDIFFCGAAGD